MYGVGLGLGLGLGLASGEGTLFVHEPSDGLVIASSATLGVGWVGKLSAFRVRLRGL